MDCGGRRMNVVRIGIIGSGFMGRTNAETVSKYLQQAKLVAITGGSRAQSLAVDYQVDYEADVETLLQRRISMPSLSVPLMRRMPKRRSPRPQQASTS